MNWLTPWLEDKIQKHDKTMLIKPEVEMTEMITKAKCPFPCLSIEAPIISPPFIASLHNANSRTTKPVDHGSSIKSNPTHHPPTPHPESSPATRPTPEEDALLDYFQSDSVYRGTTVSIYEDAMADPGGITPEAVPLTFQERGAAHVARQGRTFAWAIFLAAAGVSVLLLFMLLAIFLEMSATKSPGKPPDSDTFLDPDSIDFGDAKHLSEMLRITFPLVDVRTAEQNAFIDSIRPVPKKSKNSVTSSPLVILDISPDKEANSTVIAESMAIAVADTTGRNRLEFQYNTVGYTRNPGAANALYSVGQRHSSIETDRRARAGYLMTRASLYIAQRLNLSAAEAAQGIVVDSDVGPLELHEFCPNSTGELTSCNPADPYRSYDGTCNNLRHDKWGATNEPLRRILYPSYDDGISSIRKSENGTELPNPRVISTVILKDIPTGTSNASSMLALWGQFINHDLTLTAPSTSVNATAIPCCVDGKILASQHPECLPLRIPQADPLFATGVGCMNFVRSAPAPLCEFGPREQFNQITSYLDASTLYGSNAGEAASIRTVFGTYPMTNKGRLPTSYLDDGRPLAFTTKQLDDGCNQPENVEKRQFCFKSGDKRVNEYLGITALNLVWIRQHNLISEQLTSLNKDWDEEKAFQETRRVVIAQIQHVTYNEFLPMLLGPDVMKQAGLTLLKSGYYEGYDDETEATISNEFATAGFRLGHSMIQGLMKMVGPHWKNEDFIQIHKLMNNPFRMYNMGGMDGILRGHMALATGKAGLHMSDQMRNHLFQLQNGTSGYDMAAMDIQRGRDHGIPAYLTWREKCGLKTVTDFTELNGIWTDGAAARVAAVYRSVEDIDLYVGGLAENPLPGAMVGPTFACILADQFLRLRRGDRFWYENSIQLKPFTAAQLATIRKTTLARILCNNADALLSVPVSPMEIESQSNPRVQCSSPLIPRLSYEDWEEKQSIFIKKLVLKTEDSLESLFSSEESEEETKKGKNATGSSNSTVISYSVPILKVKRTRNSTESTTEKVKQINGAGNGIVDTKEGKIIKFAGK